MTSRKLDLSKAPWRERRPENQFRGYYISFDPTGCDPVDEILRAIAAAAKGYHSTEGWDDPDAWGEDEPTYLDWIQAAANAASDRFKAEVSHDE